MRFEFILENGKREEVAVPKEAKVYRAILYVKNGRQIAIGIPEGIEKVYLRK